MSDTKIKNVVKVALQLSGLPENTAVDLFPQELSIPGDKYTELKLRCVLDSRVVDIVTTMQEVGGEALCYSATSVVEPSNFTGNIVIYPHTYVETRLDLARVSKCDRADVIAAVTAREIVDFVTTNHEDGSSDLLLPLLLGLAENGCFERSIPKLKIYWHHADVEPEISAALGVHVIRFNGEVIKYEAVAVNRHGASSTVLSALFLSESGAYKSHFTELEVFNTDGGLPWCRNKVAYMIADNIAGFCSVTE